MLKQAILHFDQGALLVEKCLNGNLVSKGETGEPFAEDDNPVGDLTHDFSHCFLILKDNN